LCPSAEKNCLAVVTPSLVVASGERREACPAVGVPAQCERVTNHVQSLRAGKAGLRLTIPSDPGGSMDRPRRSDPDAGLAAPARQVSNQRSTASGRDSECQPFSLRLLSSLACRRVREGYAGTVNVKNSATQSPGSAATTRKVSVSPRMGSTVRSGPEMRHDTVGSLVVNAAS